MMPGGLYTELSSLAPHRIIGIVFGKLLGMRVHSTSGSTITRSRYGVSQFCELTHGFSSPSMFRIPHSPSPPLRHPIHFWVFKSSIIKFR
jgi:hypothetical protein